VFTHDDKQVLGERPLSHQSATIAVRELFPTIPANDTISFYTDEPEICGGKSTEISSAAWCDITPRLQKVTVKSESPNRRSSGKFDGKSNGIFS